MGVVGVPGGNGATGGLLIPAILLLFLLSFLFSGLEAAFFSFGRYRLRELCASGDSGAERLARLFKRPGRLVSILVILNITVNVILTSLWASASLTMVNSTGASVAVFLPISAAVLAILIILFAEITPKALFTKYSEWISLTFADFMLVICRMITPLSWVLEGIAKILLNSFRATEREKGKTVTEEEIIDIVTVGESEGVIDYHEKEIIHSIFEFGDRQVKEVMVPRTDVVAIGIDADLKQAMEVIVSSGYTRMPVYEGSIDSIVGVLMAPDLLPLIGRGEIEKNSVKGIMRKDVYYIPETKPVRELFNEFQRHKISIAVAVDEHGGTAGVITTEDMLEEIVGEIADEHDTVEPLIERQPDGSFILEGKVPLYELEELFNLNLESENYDTVGGLILAKLGSIPKEGQIAVDSSLKFEVLKVDANRITRLRVWKMDGEGAWELAE